MELVKNPTSVVNDSAYGNVPWVNPDGFRLKNYGEAKADLQPTDVTQYAKAVFDCSDLPSGVTLTGIKLEWLVGDRLSEVGQPGDASVRLAVAGTPVGDDKARPSESWLIAPRYRAYGGDGDLWASGLTADAVRSDGLTALFAAKWRANPNAPGVPDGVAKPRGDEIRLTLYYV